MTDTSDPIARTDQAKAEIKHVAPILWSHFDALCKEGFQRTEAMDLVRDFQQTMIGVDDDDED